jgi:type IV pilus assembly protein PilC
MPVYRYRAKKTDGRYITGVLDANSETEVVRMLKQKNQYTVSIKQYEGNSSGIWIKRTFGKVKQKDLAVFCRQFSTVINAGVPILTSLDILRKQTENARMRQTVGELYEEVQKGNSLSSVMAVHGEVFPELLVNMIEAGEISGTLDCVMERMADHYEKEYRIGQKVKNSLVYPSLIAVVALFVIIMLVAVVLPTFISIFEDMGATLPLSTRLLIFFSSVITECWPMLLALTVVLCIVFKLYSKTENGRELMDTFKIKAPIVGRVNKKVITARFARTLGALTSSGISLLEGIEVAKKVVGNAVLRKDLIQVEEDVKRGRGLAEPLRNVKILHPMLIQMVKIGEDTGTLDYILVKTADIFDDEVESAVTRMTTLLEPAIIVVMAVVVGFIVVSIVIPMFDMMTNLKF